jgi:YVTN family beta-propeller protein
VSSRKANMINAVDPAGKKILNSLKSGKGPFVTTFSADSRFAYITLRDDGKLAVIDTALEGEFILAEFEKMGQPHDARPVPNREELYVTDSKGGRVLIVHPFTFSILGEIKVGNVPGKVWFSKDGKLAFVLIEDDGNLVVIDTEARKVVATAPVGKAPESMVIY